MQVNCVGWLQHGFFPALLPIFSGLQFSDNPIVLGFCPSNIMIGTKFLDGKVSVVGDFIPNFLVRINRLDGILLLNRFKNSQHLLVKNMDACLEAVQFQLHVLQGLVNKTPVTRIAIVVVHDQRFKAVDQQNGQPLRLCQGKWFMVCEPQITLEPNNGNVLFF